MNIDRMKGVLHMLICGDSIWRWDDISDEFDNMTVGDAQYKMLQQKMLIIVKEFIKEIFSYDFVDVITTSRPAIDSDKEHMFNCGVLSKVDDHSEFVFEIRFFDDIQTFKITKLPLSQENKDANILFRSIVEYLRSYYTLVKSNAKTHELGHLLASEELLLIADKYLYNLKKSIIIEYLHRMFNITWESNGNISYQIKHNKRTLDLLCTIHDFGLELSTRRIESEEIFSGFIFLDDLDVISERVHTLIDIENPIRFGDFKTIKSVLNITDGKQVFFVVKGWNITSVVKMKEKLFDNMNSLSKNDIDLPLIMSVQGIGKVEFFKGDFKDNKKILSVENNRYAIRDSEFLFNRIASIISHFSIGDQERLKHFIKWVLGRSKSGHGTTILVGDFCKDLADKLIKCTPVSSLVDFFSNEDFMLLNNLTNPDGAIIFNTKLEPLFIASILPFAKNPSTSGGSRHNSAISFSTEFKCTGIVVSEDGPISLLHNGEVVLKL